MSRTPSEIENLFKKILQSIEEGTPLRRIVGTPGQLSRRKFYDLIKESEPMRERYARAKELAAEALYDEMLEIARTPIEATETTNTPQGVIVKTADALGHRRLLIDTIKWRLGKERPEKYGDKLDVTSGNKPLAVPAVIGMRITNTAKQAETIEPDDNYDLD